MGNQLLNATGLDTVADWESSLGGELSVDEAIIGAPGRLVLGSRLQGVAKGDRVDLATSTVAVSIGELLEVSCFYAAGEGYPTLELEIVDGTGDGDRVTAKQILPTRPARAAGPSRGVASTFAFAYQRLRAPATGHARLRTVATAHRAGDVAAYMLRPFLDVGGLPRDRQLWAAGPHSNPDLSLEAWPSTLPPISPSTWAADPTPTRRGFTGDSGVPHYTRNTRNRRFTGRGSMQLDALQRDELERFFREASEPFYFLRPDTHELCRARWTDAEPKDSGVLPGERRTMVELFLEVV